MESVVVAVILPIISSPHVISSMGRIARTISRHLRRPAVDTDRRCVINRRGLVVRCAVINGRWFSIDRRRAAVITVTVIAAGICGDAGARDGAERTADPSTVVPAIVLR